MTSARVFLFLARRAGRSSVRGSRGKFDDARKNKSGALFWRIGRICPPLPLRHSARNVRQCGLIASRTGILAQSRAMSEPLFGKSRWNVDHRIACASREMAEDGETKRSSLSAIRLSEGRVPNREAKKMESRARQAKNNGFGMRTRRSKSEDGPCAASERLFRHEQSKGKTTETKPSAGKRKGGFAGSRQARRNGAAVRPRGTKRISEQIAIPVAAEIPSRIARFTVGLFTAAR